MNCIFTSIILYLDIILCLLIYVFTMDIVSSVDKVIKNIKFKHV